MRRLAFTLLVPLLVGGCTPDSLGPSLRLVVAPQVDSSMTCSGVPNDLSLPMLNAATIRMTAVVKKIDPMTMQPSVTAMCDISVAATSDINKVIVAYPLGSGDKVDFFAEAWDANGQRLASGALLSQSTDAHATLPDLRLYATESFRCFTPPVNAGPSVRQTFRLAQSRAFHTATTLPNGQILVAGGLIPATAGDTVSNDQYFLTGTVEVYDPPTGTFISFGNEPTPTDRAFHQAVLLPDAGTGVYKVALIGGLSTTVHSTAVLHNYTGEPAGFRFTTNGSSQAAAGMADNSIDVVTYDSTAKTIKRDKVVGFHPTAFQAGASLPGGGVVLAGGATYSGGLPTLDKHFDASDPTLATVKSGMLPDTRFAGSLALFGNGGGTSTGIIVGGISDTNAAMTTSPLARVVVPAGNPTATPYYVKSTFPFPNLEFATLTVLPGPTPQILVSGGLEVNGRLATNPKADASASLYLIDTTDNAAIMAPCMVNMMPSMCPAYAAKQVAAGPGFRFDPTCKVDMLTDIPHYKPVAWNAATLLPSGDRVLLTGGTARSTIQQPTCQDCDGTDTSLACALKQSAIYRPGTNDVVPITPNGATVYETLQIPRFGHTQSILPDGKVAIIGGFSRKGTTTTIGVAEVEIWNPARKLPVTDSAGDVDDPVRAELVALHVTRPPAKVGPPTSGAFAYTNCCIPGDDTHPCPK